MIVWLLLCVLAPGCLAPRMVELREHPHNPLAERLKLTARGGARPSDRTHRLLNRYALAGQDRESRAEQLDRLQRIHQQEPSIESCYAIAELSYLQGKKLELAHRKRAHTMYWQAVRYAYAYLFAPEYEKVRNPYDPQFRGACDVYNTALESCLRFAQRRGVFQPGRTMRLGPPGQQLQVSIDPQGFRWKPEDFDRFEFVSDYKVVGLSNQYRTYGLGVPLIAIRRSSTDRDESEEFCAPNLSFPVTAFLRIAPVTNHSTHHSDTLHSDTRFSLSQPPMTQSAELPTVALELYDSLETTAIDVADSRVPLQSDVTTPLAYFLDNPEFQHLDTLGLLRPDRAEEMAGLYMLQPYQPGKIPVLMVHGLWSSPMTWMEAFNDLRNTPGIRENYQFWFYMYPTGKPFWESAAELREDLADAQSVFDRQGHDPDMDQMVVVGHSMGGLMARLLTIDSGNRYWNAVSDTPFSIVKGSDEVKRQIQRVFFFESNPSVSRVVMIGSPHRGSPLVNNFTQWLGRKVIMLPRRTIESTASIFRDNPSLFRQRDSAEPFTSVDALSPRSPILQTLRETPAPLSVKQHSVIGAIEDAPLHENSDGIVSYDSAHLDHVESELVVAAEHSRLHRHPETIQEIRRILLEHLREVRQYKAAAGNQVRNADFYSSPGRASVD